MVAVVVVVVVPLVVVKPVLSMPPPVPKVEVLLVMVAPEIVTVPP